MVTLNEKDLIQYIVKSVEEGKGFNGTAEALKKIGHVSGRTKTPIVPMTVRHYYYKGKRELRGPVKMSVVELPKVLNQAEHKLNVVTAILKLQAHTDEKLALIEIIVKDL